jgi:hypothetical protein
VGGDYFMGLEPSNPRDLIYLFSHMMINEKGTCMMLPDSQPDSIVLVSFPILSQVPKVISLKWGKVYFGL